MTQPGGYKAVDYSKLTAVLIEAVKELKNENTAMQARMLRMEEALKLFRLESKSTGSLADARP